MRLPERMERLPDIESLRCFVEAAHTLNFSAAARTLGLTPAAFGQRIKRLEDDLGRPLFERTTRRVVPTPSGMALLPVAERTLALVGECVRAARGLTVPAQVDIVLGTRHELGVSWLLPELPRLHEALPGVTTHLFFGSGRELEARIVQRRVDCAVTSRRVIDPRLDGVRLHREEYAFVGTPAVLERAPFRRPEDAASHVLVDVTEDLPLFGYWMEGAGVAHRPPFTKLLRMGTIAAVRAMVVSGGGIAVIPRYYVTQDLASGVLVEIMPEVQARPDWFRLVYRTDDRRQALFEVIATALAAAPLR